MCVVHKSSAQASGMLGMGERTYNLWWSGKGDGAGGVGGMVKELCENEVEV